MSHVPLHNPFKSMLNKLHKDVIRNSEINKKKIINLPNNYETFLPLKIEENFALVVYDEFIQTQYIDYDFAVRVPLIASVKFPVKPKIYRKENEQKNTFANYPIIIINTELFKNILISPFTKSTTYKYKSENECKHSMLNALILAELTYMSSNQYENMLKISYDDGFTIQLCNRKRFVNDEFLFKDIMIYLAMNDCINYYNNYLQLFISHFGERYIFGNNYSKHMEHVLNLRIKTITNITKNIYNFNKMIF